MNENSDCDTKINPPKPDDGFPLWLHPSGRWCKKIRQKVHYFGAASDREGALKEWLRVKDNLLAGEPRPAKPGTDGKLQKATAGKPDKDFPLWLHPSGRWCRKILGKAHYFGKEDNPQAALEKWLDQKDDLLAGRTPRAKSDGLLIGDPPHRPDSAVGLVNRFLSAKRERLATREFTHRSFQDYEATCRRLVDVFGWARRVDDLEAEDFGRLRAEISKTRGPVALANEIGRVRVVLKFAVDRNLIPGLVRYGKDFDKPSRKSIRVDRADRGPRVFDAEEIRRMVIASSQPLNAMILLAINAGMGQSDLTNMPASAINLKTGWLTYPRPKTGIERRCWLWPQTVKAVREVMGEIPIATDPVDAGLLFITKYGARWTRTNEKERISTQYPRSSASCSPRWRSTATGGSTRCAGGSRRLEAGVGIRSPSITSWGIPPRPAIWARCTAVGSTRIG